MAASPAKERRSRSRSALSEGITRALKEKYEDISVKCGLLALSSLQFVQSNEGKVLSLNASPSSSNLTLAVPGSPSSSSSGSSKPNRTVFCALSKEGELTCVKIKGEKVLEILKLGDAKSLAIFKPFGLERTRSRPTSCHASASKSKKTQTKKILYFPFALEFPSLSVALLASDNAERQAWMNTIAAFLSAEASLSKSGWLLTKTAVEEQWKREYLVLDYASSKLKIYPNKIVSEQNPAQVSSELSLNPITLLKSVSADNGSCEIQLQTPAATRYLQTISAEDRDDWLHRLRQIEQKNEPFHTFAASTPSESTAAPALVLHVHSSDSESNLTQSEASVDQEASAPRAESASPSTSSSSLTPTTSSESPASSSSVDTTSSSSSSSSLSSDTLTVSASSESSAAHVLLDYSKIIFGERLAGGTFGTVHKGEYNGMVVAIKVLKDLDEVSLRGFKAELEVMAMFVNSPYIIRSYGGCVEPKPCLVLEFATGGSLPSYLKRPELPFSLKDAYLFGKDVARGLEALHNATPQILHRDLKSLNILVQESEGSRPVCKLCDFGLARFNTQANSDTLLTLRGTYEYVAPEVLGKTAYITASDMYSYGIILYELMIRALTGKYSGPYEGLKMPSVAILVRVMRGTRPPIPPSCPDQLKAMIELCWDAKPDVRPPAEQIIQLLDAWDATLE